MLRETFSETNGQPSFMRVMGGFALLVILGTWSVVCIQSGAFNGDIWEPLAAIFGWKVGQKFIEEKS